MAEKDYSASLLLVAFNANKFRPNSDMAKTRLSKLNEQVNRLDEAAQPPSDKHMAVRATYIL